MAESQDTKVDAGELLPCPFCGGGQPRLLGPGVGETTWRVVCSLCYAGGSACYGGNDARERAITAWNRRKADLATTRAALATAEAKVEAMALEVAHWCERHHEAEAKVRELAETCEGLLPYARLVAEVAGHHVANEATERRAAAIALLARARESAPAQPAGDEVHQVREEHAPEGLEVRP